jgi:hypothetical protein
LLVDSGSGDVSNNLNKVLTRNTHQRSTPQVLKSATQSSGSLIEQKQRNSMGDFIPEVKEVDATAETVLGVYDKLESLIRSQLAEEKSVGDVLIAFRTPVVSIGIMDAGDITATTFGSPRSRRDTANLERREALR